MTSKKEFREWLENESYHPLLIEDSPGWETVHCKVPKDHRYVYLFSLKYGYSEMKSVSELQNVGIYDKVRKKIYNSNGHF